MSRHPSLKFSSIDSQHRNVLKRYERVKHMKEKSTWKEESSIFGLPKIKRIRLKIKKEKPEEAAKEAAEVSAQTPGTAPAENTRQATEKKKGK